jgi:protein-L-isoaspartate(D-aspartate) O-methyltransferase
MMQVALERRSMTRVLAPTLALVILAAIALAADDFATERRLMVEEIETLAASTAAETGRTSLDPGVLEAMAKVPRHEFVPREEASAAYKNRPLPIGHGQTISQPFIVALMTDLLRTKPTDSVLEVGTGSGYQAAVLSLLAREVYTIEIIEELGKEAADRLTRLGYANVRTKIGDGYQGWAEHAPFDAIIVTAASDHVPYPPLEQLKPNGRMVIPVGGLTQDLMLIVKNPDGTGISTTIAPVRFVPLIHGVEKSD